MSRSDVPVNPSEPGASGPPGEDVPDPRIGRPRDVAREGVARGIGPLLSAKISTISFLMVFFVILIHSETRDRSGTTDHLSGVERLSSLIQMTISEGFARVAVPIYFAISGFLFFQGYAWRAGFFRKKFAARLTSLVLPYAAWSGLWLLAFSLLQSFPRTRPYCQNMIIRDMTPGQVLWTWTLDPIPVQLWYIRDLILLCLLTPLLGPALEKAPVPTLLAWSLNVFFFPNVPVNMKILNPDGFFFFSAGGAIALHGLARKFAMPVFVPVLWAALCLIHAHLDLSDPRSPWVFPLQRSSILVGVWAVWGGYDRFAHASSPPAWSHGSTSISSYGTFLFLAHVPLINFINKRLLTLVRSPWSSLLTYFLGFLVTVCLCLAAGILLKRTTPRLYAFLTGGR